MQQEREHVWATSLIGSEDSRSGVKAVRSACSLFSLCFVRCPDVSRQMLSSPRFDNGPFHLYHQRQLGPSHNSCLALRLRACTVLSSL